MGWAGGTRSKGDSKHDDVAILLLLNIIFRCSQQGQDCFQDRKREGRGCTPCTDDDGVPATQSGGG